MLKWIRDLFKAKELASRKKYTRLSEEELIAFKAMVDEGFGIEEVVKEFDISRSTYYKYRREWRKHDEEDATDTTND